MSGLTREQIYLKAYQASAKTLKELDQGAGIEHLTPQQTDLFRVQLSSLYGIISDELAIIEKKKAIDWLALKTHEKDGTERPKPISDKMTDTVYDTTPDGQRRIEIKFRLKAIEKMISALAGHLRRLHEEARNEF